MIKHTAETNDEFNLPFSKYCCRWQDIDKHLLLSHSSLFPQTWRQVNLFNFFLIRCIINVIFYFLYLDIKRNDYTPDKVVLAQDDVEVAIQSGSGTKDVRNSLRLMI